MRDSKNKTGSLSENHPLAPLTIWRICGVAARLAGPADLADVWGLMELAQDRGWPVFLLSRGPGAGWFIEAAGFKWRRLGDAFVSRKRANLILNQKRPSAAQVKALIMGIQENIWRTQGVALEREVVFLPEDVPI
jgi:UDP-N-acetylenolpyruvoylglucosamine reductase